MKDLDKYIRVGVNYYKSVEIPLTNDTYRTLINWSKQTIIDDYGKNAISKIEKFEAFCIIPSHDNFEAVIKNCYNKYEALSYKPSNNGSCENILNFLKHIFGNQFELGLDYISLLWKKPSQMLPVLCLVSDERNTGKTTFLNLMKAIFEGNMTLNTNEDFRSRFNSDWSGKLIIAIDEVLLDKKEDSERIKNLSTSKYYKSESKGKDREELEFHGKFILCSNNEENFIKIDSNEIRYWVRKIMPLNEENDISLLSKMKNEVPYFTYYLKNRELSTTPSSRMWFSAEQIHTTALDKLMYGNRTTIEKEIEELLTDEFAISNENVLNYTSKDIVDMLKKRNVVVQNNYVSTILKSKFGLSPINSSYKCFRSDIFSPSSPIGSNFTNEKGRFYTFDKEKLSFCVELLKNE